MNKIYMIGDSTMQFNNIFSYPQTGWSQGLSLFVKENVIIESHAKNGRSTKSFKDEGRFAIVLDKLQAGDFVICQFGHNDPKDDPLRYSNHEQYVKNLKYYADCVTEKGATIVFATSITRNQFENNICIDSHQGYPQQMINFALENGYACIDLNTLTRDIYTRLGEKNTSRFHMMFPANVFPNYPDGKNDTTHLVYEGAVMIAETFVKNLAKTNSRLSELFVNLEEKEFIDQKMLKD